MKRKLCLLLALVLSVAIFTGCSSQEETFEIAYVTGIAGTDDQSINQALWEGLTDWATENNKTFKSYEPQSEEKTDLVNALYQAIVNGAKNVIAMGFIYPPALIEVATANPDINFVLIDSGLGEDILPNVATFQYQAEDSGWLAGYASVMNGFTKLAYVGGISYPTVYGAGHGFVQGADYAARELGINISMQYGFTGNFDDSPENKAMMTAIYSDGTEVIFSFGGNNVNSAYSAATEADPQRFVITPDFDATGLNDRAISSALKRVEISVAEVLDDIYNNDFATYSNKDSIVGIEEGMVGLPIENSKFENFGVSEYEAAIEILKEQEIIVSAEANDTTDEETFIELLNLTNTDFRFIS